MSALRKSTATSSRYIAGLLNNGELWLPFFMREQGRSLLVSWGCFSVVAACNFPKYAKKEAG